MLNTVRSLGRVATRRAILAVAALLLWPALLGGSSPSASAQSAPAVRPTVTSIAPNSGPTAGGTPITVTGTGFGAATTLSIGNVAATNVVLVSATEITGITPPHAAGAVNVTASNPSTGPNALSGSLTGAFTYLAAASTPGPTATATPTSTATAGEPPSVGAVVPSTGSIAGGTVVTISGGGFATGVTVRIGGVAATNVSVQSASQLTATTPAHAAGAADVEVTKGSIRGLRAGGFTYVAVDTPVLGAISITGIAPASGPVGGGTVVTVSGSGFTAGTSLLIGGVPATGITVSSASTLTATAPAHGAGPVDVVISTDGVAVTFANGYTYQTLPAFDLSRAGFAGGALPAQGFALAVFNGGSNSELATASGCPLATAAFWSSDADGRFVIFVPGTPIQAVNTEWNERFPAGIPAQTPLIGRCA